MKQYSIYPSTTLFSITMTLYLLACFCLMVYFNTSVPAVLTLLLFLLMVFAEGRNFVKACQQKPEIISLYLSTNDIERTSDGDKQLFHEYSVYTSRWGMVLKLKNRWAGYNLILLPDRLEDKNEYLDLRYRLIQMKQVINAS